ncbi:MAG: PAS domain S-box protein [Candidatus Kapabacteria bacterium]|nr:PAS domain S-box protein [Ignavibacteriota bacterium]MCW5885504.1 PAS domain S-box protein [Candidatus Kapabacteria bacterium]
MTEFNKISKSDFFRVNSENEVDIDFLTKIEIDKTNNYSSNKIENIRFTDLFDINELQSIQDKFAAATGVASIITDTSGVPITKPSNFCRLCKDIIRGTKKGYYNCRCSDAIIGRFNPEGPNIQKCLSGGLWDAGASIYVGEKHIANWLIGQIRNEKLDYNEIIQYADEIGADKIEFQNAFEEVKEMSLDEFNKIADFLYNFANNISKTAYQNYILAQLVEEKYQKEKLIKENEDRLKLSLSVTNQGLYDLNIQTGEAIVNDEYAEMLGYDPKTFCETNSFWIERMHPEDKDKCFKIFTDYIQGKIAEYKVEFRQKKRNGDWIWILSVGKIVEYDPDGKPLRMIGTHNNIQEKKNYENEIQTSLQTLSDVVSSIPNGLFVYQFNEPDRLILIDGNSNAIEITGIKLASNIGKEFDEIWTNAKRTGLKDKCLSVIRNQVNIEIDSYEYYDKNLSGIFRINIFHIPGKRIGIVFDDITVQKRNEMALKESEERYRMLVENQNEYVVKVNSDNKFLYVSPSYCKLFNKTEEELLHNSFFPLVHPDDLSHTLAEMEKLTREPYSCYVEQRVMTGKGWRWLAWSDKAITDNTGKISYIIGVGRDITDRKNAEVALEEKNEQALLLKDIASELSEMTSKDIITQYISDTIKKITNSGLVIFSEYSDTEKCLISKHFLAEDSLLKLAANLMGKSIKNFKTPISPAVYKEIISSITHYADTFTEISGGVVSPTIDKAMKLISGFSHFHTIAYVVDKKLYGVTLFALKDNQKAPSDEFLKSFAHITAISLRRMQVEEKFNIISRGIEQSPALVVITNSKGIIEYVNPSFVSVTGYEAEEVIGKNPNILKSGNTQNSVYMDLWENLRNKQQWTGEFHNKKKNGELFWEYAVISPILNDNNEITHFIAVKQDITEMKKMTDDLIEAKEQAEESDKLKTAFLQNISHEIRTPLNGIIGFTQLLKLPEVPNTERIYYASTIQKSGKRLLEIVNNVMELSKIETGQSVVKLEKVNITSLINDLFVLFKYSNHNENLEFKLNIQDEEVILNTDELKLNQILTNLIGNAVKFSEVGFIEIGLKFDNAYIICWVKDTGCGISKEMHEKVFERFYQGDTSITRGYEGAGLGLAICKAFTEQLGGYITLESEVGMGSEFKVYLPRE